MERERQVGLLQIEYSTLSEEELQDKIRHYQVKSRATLDRSEKVICSYHIEALEAVAAQKTKK